MARSQISICNAALDALPAGTINDIDEADIGARACKRRYQPTLEDLLGEHDYDAAIRRAVLAEITNDRENEWRYCYAMPTDVASPRRILPSYTAAAVSTAYVLQPGQTAWAGIGFFPGNVGARFTIADNKIFTNMPDGVLEYVTTGPTLSHFRPLFFRAFELELAARIVMPVLKDTKREKELIQLAEVARQRAMADDLNSFPERTFDFVSENAMVRLGGVSVDQAAWGTY